MSLYDTKPKSHAGKEARPLGASVWHVKALHECQNRSGQGLLHRFDGLIVRIAIERFGSLHIGKFDHNKSSCRQLSFFGQTLIRDNQWLTTCFAISASAGFTYSAWYFAGSVIWKNPTR